MHNIPSFYLIAAPVYCYKCLSGSAYNQLRDNATAHAQIELTGF